MIQAPFFSKYAEINYYLLKRRHGSLTRHNNPLVPHQAMLFTCCLLLDVQLLGTHYKNHSRLIPKTKRSSLQGQSMFFVKLLVTSNNIYSLPAAKIFCYLLHLKLRSTATLTLVSLDHME